MLSCGRATASRSARGELRKSSRPLATPAWQHRPVLSRQKQPPDPAGMTIEPIDRHPDCQTALAALQALESRLAESEERRRRAKARLLGAKPNRSLAERAGDLVRGGHIPAVDPAQEIAAAVEEQKLLRAAMIEAQTRLDEVSREIQLRDLEEIQIGARRGADRGVARHR
jgi:hypothetical protein